jgi:aminocarboxymuconate-semialdehyde decarboxylase
MRYIDAFNHFFPKRYYEALLETPAGAKDLGKRVRGIPALSDLELRLSIVESFDDYSQLLSHGLPPMERLWGPDKYPRWRRSPMTASAKSPPSTRNISSAGRRCCR